MQEQSLLPFLFHPVRAAGAAAGDCLLLGALDASNKSVI